MRDPVVQEIPLGFQWTTLDPFLFCVHHLDMYPAGNGKFGPVRRRLTDARSATTSNRSTGGGCITARTCPVSRSIPHRGFETVTFVRQGLIDHSDSLGATARFGRGDTQWLTAGSGIVHSEMFPLVDTVEPNPTELFQIWLNLPSTDKMVEPYFTMLWNDDIPVVEFEGGSVTVVAGESWRRQASIASTELVGGTRRRRGGDLGVAPRTRRFVDHAGDAACRRRSRTRVLLRGRHAVDRRSRARRVDRRRCAQRR